MPDSTLTQLLVMFAWLLSYGCPIHNKHLAMWNVVFKMRNAMISCTAITCNYLNSSCSFLIISNMNNLYIYIYIWGLCSSWLHFVLWLLVGGVSQSQPVSTGGITTVAHVGPSPAEPQMPWEFAAAVTPAESSNSWHIPTVLNTNGAKILMISIGYHTNLSQDYII